MVEPIQIKLNDSIWGFHFNNYALVELGKTLKCDAMNAHSELMKIAEDDAVSGITLVLHAGFVGDAKANGNFFHGITLASVAKEMATCNTDDFTEAYEQFVKATGIAEFIQSLPEDTTAEKKK